MTNEEKIRLVLETLGVDNVKQATKAIRDMEEAAEDLGDEIKSGLIKANGDLLLTLKDGQKITANSAEGFRKLLDQQGKFFVTLSDGQKRLMDADDATRAAADALSEYQERAFQASRSIDDLQESHIDLYRAMQQRGTPAMDAHVQAFRQHKEAAEQNQRATQAFGQRVLEASYAIDDLQYGFRGIVNNVPGIARAFGLTSSVIGAVGIAAVAVNQALQILGPLFESTEKPIKPLNERLDEFAKGMGQSAVETEKLKNAIDSMAKTSVPGLFTELYKSVNSIRELIQAQKELNAIKEEDAKRQGQREAEDKKINEGLDTDKASGQLVDEFLGNADTKDNAERLAGIRDKIAKDEIQRAINETVDEELAAMEARGDFGEYTFLPAAQTAMKQARSQLMKQTGPNDPAVRRRAEKIAAGKMDAARNGDEQAIREIEALVPEIGQFREDDAAEKQFQGRLSERAKFVANRNEIRSKRSIEQANNPQIPDAIRAQRQLEAEQIAAGEKIGAAVGPNGAMFDAEKNRRILEERAKAEAAEKTRRDIMIGLADVLPDPVSLAAMRRGNAGTDRFAVGRMRAMEATDQQALFGTFRNAGMNEDDAKRSVAEYMQQGNEAFSEFAQANGMNAKNLSSGFKASQALLQKIMQDQEETQEIVRWMESMMNMQNQPQAKPPNRVRN